MPWWHSAFFSSHSSAPSPSHSSSSSPSPSSSADYNYTNNRTSGRISDGVSLFTPRRIVGSHNHRRVTGSRSFQHLTDDDVAPVHARSISTHQTFPLPELSVLLKRDSHRESAANQTLNYILPSPEEANKKSAEDRGISDSSHSDSKGSPNIAAEHKKSQFFQKRPPELNFTASLRDGHKDGEAASAPATSLANGGVLHPTSKSDMFTSNHLSSQDITAGAANHNRTIPERSVHGSNGSPVYSPPKRTSVKSPMPSSSPLHKNLSTGNPMTRRDSNAQATMSTVHPLPLPPGAAVHQPSSPVQTNKPDLLSKTPKQSRWQKGKLIGRGTFGSVYVGSNRETGALCAMKEVEILPDDAKSAESIKQLEQEIDVLRQLKHPNIVQYYGSEIVGDRLYIYLEYVHPGSINKYVRDHCGGMTECIVRNFTRHIVSGLAYLHSTKTIHRDIKGANLLVDANGVVKLADFGMAKHLNGQVNLSLKGSPYWMAPELLQGETQKDVSLDLALAVDIWSLGCTIIEMMQGKPPWSEYEGPAAMFKVMKETPPIPETMSPDGKDFLRCCFVRNPAERPTASMLLEHRFLNNSAQLDVSTSTKSLNRMTMMVQNRRERFSHTPDQLSIPTYTPATKGKHPNKFEKGQRLILRLPTATKLPYSPLLMGPLWPFDSLQAQMKREDTSLDSPS